jgi:hypothetical protein
MNQNRTALLFVAFTLSLASCGASGSAGTGGGGSAAVGTGGQGGDTPADASAGDGARTADVEPDHVVTCEDRDGNACTIMPEAQGCQRCVQSCCCDAIAACRADAACAGAIPIFNDCLRQGNTGLACLVPVYEALTDAALFVAIADCEDMERCDLTCPL